MARITNIVATADLNCTLNLPDIEQKLPMAQYLPRQFAGLLLRIFAPKKAHCQLYSNGKITLNGGTTLDESRILLTHFAQMLQDIGYLCVPTNFRTVNVVGSCDFGKRLDLGALAKQFDVWYEPELFPGLRIRLETCSAVLFHTGKCNFLGGKDESDIYAGYLELVLQI